MDSLTWSRTYEVLSISRLMLRDQFGFSPEQVASLTDEDMQALADLLREEVTQSAGAFVAGDFLPTVRFIVSLYFAEKGKVYGK